MTQGGGRDYPPIGGLAEWRMDLERPYCIDGVWIAPLSTGFLCETCRNRISHWRGGATCSVDPLHLTITRSCRGYEAWKSPEDEAIHVAFRLACDDAFGKM